MTLNQLKYKLKGFFQSHKQINSVYYESDFDFNAERNIVYPVANIEYINSSINNNAVNHNYKIVLGDAYNPNIAGHDDEIVSDLLQVAEDFFTWLQNSEDFSLNKSSSLNPFYDSGSDRVSGTVFTISLGNVRPQNDCLTPLK